MISDMDEKDNPAKWRKNTSKSTKKTEMVGEIDKKLVGTNGIEEKVKSGQKARQNAKLSNGLRLVVSRGVVMGTVVLI